MSDEKREELLKLLLDEYNIEDIKENNDSFYLHKLQNIIENNFPPYLYKYRPGNDWDLDALENDSIWMSIATKVDDPEDSKILITDEFRNQIDFVVNNIDCFDNDKYKKLLEDSVIQGECFLCSLSEISDSEDMWGRYANDSQGICIEYDARELWSNLRFLLLPVCYRKKISYSAEMFANSSKKKIIITNFLAKNKEGIEKEDWYSQREWRIIAFRETLGLGKDENGKCIKIIKPTRVILGKNVSQRVKSWITRWKEKAGNESIRIVQQE